MRSSPQVLAEAKVVFLLTVALLLIVPFHAVLMPEQVLLALECIAVILLLIVFWSGLYQKKTYKVVLWFLWLSLFTGLIYVIPLPFLSDYELQGRELYQLVYQWLGSQGLAVQSTYLSIIPYNSVLALLALLPPIALFFAGISLPEVHIRYIIYLLLAIAGIEGAIGLIQYASNNLVFYFGLTPSGGRSAQGTYVNRDHFAALLELTLPIAIGLMLFSVGRAQNHRGHSEKNRLLNQTLLFAFIAVFIFLAAVFTRSRAGVFLIMLAVLLSSVIFARHIGGRQSVGVAAVFTTISVGVATTIGLIPVLNRFVARNPLEDERWFIFKHTIEGIQALFPFGSGPGTFADVYRAFQPTEQTGFVNSAHNDYLELLFDMGAFGAFIIIGFLLLYIMGWFKLAGEHWNRMRFIQVASGISIFLILLHCSMDFILHEPMNTMIFAFLVGVFLSKREHKSSRH